MIINDNYMETPTQTQTYEEFIKNIKKVTGNRHHNITGSAGVYQYYLYYRKNRPRDKKFILSSSEYYKILEACNTKVSNAVAEGNEVIFPESMGSLTFNKYEKTPEEMPDGTIKMKTPINWEETFKLWYSDPEALASKTVVKIDSGKRIRLIYNKCYARYKNKSFFLYKPNRTLRINVYKNVLAGKIDAFS